MIADRFIGFHLGHAGDYQLQVLNSVIKEFKEFRINTNALESEIHSYSGKFRLFNSFNGVHVSRNFIN